MIQSFWSCDLVMWEEVSIFAVQNLLAMSFIFPSSDKIHRYHEYLQQLQEDSKSSKVDFDDLPETWEPQQAAIIESFFGDFLYPLLAVMKRIRLHSYLSTRNEISRMKEDLDKATIGDLYHALSLCDDDIRWYMLSQVKGIVPDILREVFGKGEDIFCDYIQNNPHLDLNGLLQWAWLVCMMEEELSLPKRAESYSSEDLLSIITSPEQLIPICQEIDVDINKKREEADFAIKQFKDGVFDVDFFLSSVWQELPRYWSINRSREEEEVVMSIVTRECSAFPKGSFLPYYLEALDVWNEQQKVPKTTENPEPSRSESLGESRQWIDYIGKHNDVKNLNEDIFRKFTQRLVAEGYLNQIYCDSLCFRLFGITRSDEGLQNPILFNDNTTNKDILYILKKLTDGTPGVKSVKKASGKFDLASAWFKTEKGKDFNFSMPSMSKDASSKIIDIVKEYFPQVEPQTN